MSEQHPKRRKPNLIEVDSTAALGVVIDWIEQDPTQSTCHIILVCRALCFSAKGKRTPRLRKRDVNVDNAKWFASFPGKTVHSFKKDAAQNGDITFLKTYSKPYYISRELFVNVRKYAMQRDYVNLFFG
jgi:hypothetical protein